MKTTPLLFNFTLAKGGPFCVVLLIFCDRIQIICPKVFHCPAINTGARQGHGILFVFFLLPPKLMINIWSFICERNVDCFGKH